MKNILISACLLVLIASCKKEQVSQSVNASVSENAIKNEDKYLQNVQRYLMNSLASTDFQLLDFKRAIATQSCSCNVNGNLFQYFTFFAP